MSVFDFKLSEKLIENNVREQTIGFSKKQIIINNTDNSKTLNLNITINVSLPEGSFPSEAKAIETIKNKTINTINKAINEKADEMVKFIGISNPSAIAIASTGVVVSHIEKSIKLDETPLPSGDYIGELFGTMNKIKFYEVGETPGVAADWEKQDEYKRD